MRLLLTLNKFLFPVSRLLLLPIAKVFERKLWRNKLFFQQKIQKPEKCFKRIFSAEVFLVFYSLGLNTIILLLWNSYPCECQTSQFFDKSETINSA